MRYFMLSLFFFVWSHVSQAQICVVTDLEHWQTEVGMGLTVPDYFTDDPAWVSAIQDQLSILLKDKFDVSEVIFYKEGVTLKSDGRDKDIWNLDEFDRSHGDLFVGISSYINANYDMSILMQVEKSSGKKLFKKKSRILLLSKSNTAGLDSDVLISEREFKETYEQLLQNFNTDKVRRLPPKTIYRQPELGINSDANSNIQINLLASDWYEPEILLKNLGPNQEVRMLVENVVDEERQQWKVFKTKRTRQGTWIIKTEENIPDWQIKYSIEQTRVMDAKILTYTEPETVASIFENGNEVGSLRVIDGHTMEGVLRGEPFRLIENLTEFVLESDDKVLLHGQKVDDLNQFENPFHKVFISTELPLDKSVRLFQLVVTWKRMLVNLPFD